MNDIALSKEIAQAVKENGGRTFYVGGFVRDKLLGIDNKDVDIEVHGIEHDRLYEIISQFGEVKTFGDSFGIFSLKYHNIDIAMPRSEKATGRGHRDFKGYHRHIEDGKLPNHFDQLGILQINSDPPHSSSNH